MGRALERMGRSSRRNGARKGARDGRNKDWPGFCEVIGIGEFRWCARRGHSGQRVGMSWVQVEGAEVDGIWDGESRGERRSRDESEIENVSFQQITRGCLGGNDLQVE